MMKKFLLSLTLAALLPLRVCADDLSGAMPDSIPQDHMLPRLVDDADLLSDNEEALLLAALDNVSERQSVDVAVVTVEELPGGYTAQEYADDVYDYYGYGMGADDDGILFLITMAEREWAITTCGYGITAFTEYALDTIEDNVVRHLSSGDYYTAFDTFASLSDTIITEAKSGGTSYPGHDGFTGDPYYDPYYDTYYYGENSSTIHNFPMILIALVIGFLVAGIPVGIWKNELQNVRSQSGASVYAKPDSLNITTRRDIFLYRNVRRTRRQTEQSHHSRPGGGHTHRSSSGRSHGGRSGGF